jgi:hypothetical protein
VPADESAPTSLPFDPITSRRRFLLGLAAAAGLWARSSRSAAAWPVVPAAAPAETTYAADRERFTRRAFAAAFGTEVDGWDPDAGFAANRAYLARLYGYYGNLYGTDPERFLWAGFARLGGVSVVGGLDYLVREPFPNYPDPSLLTVSLVGIAKAIFLDLGWLHEAFLEDPALAIELGHAHDDRFPARESYEGAWTAIASGEAAAVVEGNLRLLAIEQFSIVQPFYDRVMADPTAGPVFRQTGGAARRIHPYHRDFAAVVPGGDLADPDQRWAWINEPGGMWDAWAALPPEERLRLVELPLEDLVAQQWGPVIEELVPA